MPLTSNVRRNGNARPVRNVAPPLHATARAGRPSSRPASPSLVANMFFANFGSGCPSFGGQRTTRYARTELRMIVFVIFIYALVAVLVSLAFTGRVEKPWLAVVLSVGVSLLSQLVLGAIASILLTHPIIRTGQLPLWALLLMNLVVAVAAIRVAPRFSGRSSPRQDRQQ